MSKARYQINQFSDNYYQLFEAGTLLCIFSRENLRETLGALGRGENWIGSIVRLLNHKYPFSMPSRTRDKTDHLRAMGLEGMLNHLKSKGFRIYRKQKVEDMDIIKHLEALGYCVEGLVGDSLYSTVENNISEMKVLKC
ncbi:MAG: hypothetical protein WA610_13645 [Thermodesulfovibrionales bacterium]